MCKSDAAHFYYRNGAVGMMKLMSGIERGKVGLYYEHDFIQKSPLYD